MAFSTNFGDYVKTLISRCSDTSPATFSKRSSFNEHLPYTPSLPNSSSQDVVALQPEPSVDIHKNTLSNSSANLAHLGISTDGDDIVALFQKQIHKVRSSVGMHRFSLHIIVPTFKPSAGPNFADRSFPRATWRNRIRPAAKLRRKLGSNQPIQIDDTI